MDARDAVQHMTLFRGVEPANLDAIAAIAEPVAYAARENLFDPSHPAAALFAIVIGTVEVHLEGKDIAIVTVGSGQSIGDIAFFSRGTYGGSAITREPTRALRIPFEGIDRLLAERSSLALAFYRNAAYAFAHHLRQIAAERDRPYL
jgi:CRP-like cAMP-binding protein